MRRNAIAHFARIIIEKVCRANLEVVAGRWGNPAASVAVAKSPYSRHGGSELVVDRNVAVFVNGDAGSFQTEVVCVRRTSHRQQNVRSRDLQLIVDAVYADRDIVAIGA